MKIISLTLENIKSYVCETIHFYEGVNFVSGANGAGKTTIIEAIGYALFDAGPFSAQRRFIREGQKTGTITVVFEAQDERMYRVVRRFRQPSGGSWAVYDEEAGVELNELHGAGDVKAWLLANLNIGAQLDPAMLFEDVIAIAQGRFTAPFLEKPRDRKSIFNKILQLDSYREAFERTSGLDAALALRIKDKEAVRDSLLVRVEDWEACKAELANNRRRIEIIGRELSVVAEEISRVEKELQEQERLKERVDKLGKDYATLAVRKEALAARKNRVLKDLGDARLCRERVQAAEADYLAYCWLQEEAKTLEANRKERDALVNEQRRLETAAASLRAQLNSEAGNRANLAGQHESEIRELAGEGEKAAAAKNDALAKKAAADDRRILLEQEWESWRRPEQAVSRLKQSRAVMAMHSESMRLLMAEKDRLVKLISREAELEKTVRNIPGLEKEQRRATDELSLLNARLATLEENRQATAEGVCPFLGRPCPGIEGSLGDYFAENINALLPVLAEKKKANEALEAALAHARKALEEYNAVRNYKEQLGQVMLQAQAAQRALWEEAKELLTALEPRSIQALQASVRRSIEGLPADGGKEADELRTALDRLALLSRRYEQAYRQTGYARQGTGIKDGLGIPGNELEDGREIPGSELEDSLEILGSELEEINSLIGSIRSKTDALTNRLREEAAGSFAAADNRLATLRERYRKVSAALQALREDDSLARLERQLLEKERELALTCEKLAQYPDLDAAWENNKEKSGRLEPGYIQYMQNIEGAGKYPVLTEEAAEIEKEEGLLDLEISKLKQEMEILRAGFSEDVLARLKQDRERLLADAARKEGDRQYALREAQRYEKLVKEKELIFDEIAVLERQIAKEQRAREMLELLRATLNRSGEKMAQLYREYIGREANLIYQKISAENVHLLWSEDYEIKLIDHPENNRRERVFGQLSGGEKMTAALAVRLALLKQLSGLGIGFFDEPTANLDEKRRSNLARIIPEVTGDFSQVFVISHDDSFDAITENVIALKKDPQRGTVVADNV